MLHFAPVAPPIHSSRPAAIPAAAASNDAANEPAFLAAYREAAARQLPDPRPPAAAGADERGYPGPVRAPSLKTEMSPRVAVVTPDIEELRHPLPLISPFEKERSLRNSANSSASCGLARAGAHVLNRL